MHKTFTYLKHKRTDKIIDFLENEIHSLDTLKSINSKMNIHTLLNSYSNSIFTLSDELGDDNSIILN